MEEKVLWTVVYIAASREAADGLKEMLGREGILASVRPVGLTLVGDGCNYEVLVPEAEAEEAHELVSAILHNPRPKEALVTRRLRRGPP